MSAAANEEPEDSGADVEHLAAVLKRRRRELAGGRATIGGSSVVHAVEETMWVGVRVPVVVCRVAADPLRLRPSNGPVTCRRCRKRADGRDIRVGRGQTELEV
ncbi:hypothetical protein [Streptomonospora litoralis]|uniref:Uncharacterized protein n=1 Tax=Streptomonospora litoralis TaxID=2498135 RepID=A0A4P6PVE9_9ACTN|nr:hypothetical protein [Streptomonospora litoralis]QBI52118.1 hypothetical protein EKD16_01505 [Streptomonospora litoralis]